MPEVQGEAGCATTPSKTARQPSQRPQNPSRRHGDQLLVLYQTSRRICGKHSDTIGNAHHVASSCASVYNVCWARSAAFPFPSKPNVGIKSAANQAMRCSAVLLGAVARLPRVAATCRYGKASLFKFPDIRYTENGDCLCYGPGE